MYARAHSFGAVRLMSSAGLMTGVGGAGGPASTSHPEGMSMETTLRACSAISASTPSKGARISPELKLNPKGLHERHWKMGCNIDELAGSTSAPKMASIVTSCCLTRSAVNSL